MTGRNMIDAASHTPVRGVRSRTRRIPASGNAGLAASGLIQAALGVEFFLSGLNKFADPNFVRNFGLFVDASPGTHAGLLAPLIHAIVQPNMAFFANLTKFVELGLGIVLLLGAIGWRHGFDSRRRLAGDAVGFRDSRGRRGPATKPGQQLRHTNSLAKSLNVC